MVDEIVNECGSARVFVFIEIPEPPIIRNLSVSFGVNGICPGTSIVLHIEFILIVAIFFFYV